MTDTYDQYSEDSEIGDGLANTKAPLDEGTKLRIIAEALANPRQRGYRILKNTEFFTTHLTRTWKEKYFLLFNFVTASLWLALFIRFLILLPLVGEKFLPAGVLFFYQNVQLVSLLDIVNYFLKFDSLNVGFIPFAYLLNRFYILYVVFDVFPVVCKHTSFSYSLVAVCLFDIVRYGFDGLRYLMLTSPLKKLELQYKKLTAERISDQQQIKNHFRTTPVFAEWLYWIRYTIPVVTIPIELLADIFMILLSFKYVSKVQLDYDYLLLGKFAIVYNLVLLVVSLWYHGRKRSDKLFHDRWEHYKTD